MANSVFNGVLTADQIEDVEANPGFTQARILNVDGADLIYVTGDNTDPVAPYDDCEVLPAAIGFLVIRLSRKGVASIVKLVSPGTPTFSVKFF